MNPEELKTLREVAARDTTVMGFLRLWEQVGGPVEVMLVQLIKSLSREKLSYIELADKMVSMRAGEVPVLKGGRND